MTVACLKDIVAAASDPTSHPALKTDLGKIQFGVWLPTGMKKEEIKSLVGEALYDELTQVQLFSFSQPFWDNSTYSLQLFLTIGSVVCGIGGGQPLGSSKEIDRG